MSYVPDPDPPGRNNADIPHSEVAALRLITSSFLDCRFPAPTGGGSNPFPTFRPPFPGNPRPPRPTVGAGDTNNGYLNNGINTGVIQNGDQITEVNAGVIHVGDEIDGDQINGDKIDGDQINVGDINVGNVVNVQVRHTSYIVVFPAADHTRTWMATYTVNADCPGECSRWHNHSDPDFVPPNFVVTTVDCSVCAVRQQVITCPNALGVNPVTIEGDGITATVTVTDEPQFTLPAVAPGVADPPLEGEDPEGEGEDSFGGPIGTLPVLPAPGSSRTFSSFSPVVTAASPRSINLKQGLTLVMGLGFAVSGLVLA